MATTPSLSQDDSNSYTQSDSGQIQQLGNPLPQLLTYVNVNDYDEAIKLNEDIFHVFILHLLKISGTKRNENTIILGSSALTVFCIQSICLFALSYSYFHYFAEKEIQNVTFLTTDTHNQLSYRVNATARQVIGDILVDVTLTDIDTAHNQSVQYLSVIAALFIISCYLLQIIQTFISTLSIFVCCDTIKNSSYRLMSNCVICLNLGLIFNIWIFCTWIMWFCFDTMVISDLIIISFIVIFILEIDDWAYKWFFPKFIADSIDSGYIIVKYIEYSDIVIKFSLCAVVMCISWIVSMDLCYDMFWVEDGFKFLLISYIITVIVSIICPVIINYPQRFGDAVFALPFLPATFILFAVFSWIILNELNEIDYTGNAWIIVIAGSIIALVALVLCITSVILKDKIRYWVQTIYIIVPLISMSGALTITWSEDTKLRFQYDDELYGWFLICLALSLSPITVAVYITNHVKDHPRLKLITICVLLLILFVAYNILF